MSAVGGSLAVAPELAHEETLQPPCVAVVEFSEGIVAATCGCCHELFVGAFCASQTENRHLSSIFMNFFSSSNGSEACFIALRKVVISHS